MHLGNSNSRQKTRGGGPRLILPKVIAIISLLFAAVSINSQAMSSSQKVTLSAKNISLEEAFKILKKQSGYTFFYDHELLRNARKINVNVKNLPLEKALDACLAEQSISYTIVGKTVVLKPARKAETVTPAAIEQPAKAGAEMMRVPMGSLNPLQLSTIQQSIFETVRGKVTDETGAGLPGVNVLVKGTSQGTTTDADGQFTLNVSETNAVLVFSFVGYVPQEVVIGGRSNISVSMQVDNKSLQEVVVTALGIRKEAKALGYSVTKLEGEAFTQNRETNFMNALTGKVAGVNVVAAGTGPAGSSRVTIRGNTSISGNNQPLYIINGMPMDNSQFGQAIGPQPDWGDNISSLNPDDIEELTVLKGATAAALYGSRAKNGAIVITTKSGRGSKGIGVEFNSNNTWEVPFYIWKLQDKYGQGYGGYRPQSQTDAANHSQNHWGEVYDNAPTVQYDGVSRPYTYVKKQVLDDFYSTGNTSTNNIAFTGGGDNGSFRVGFTNMRNTGIIPNAKMNRNNISLGINQKAAKNLNISANIDYVREDVDNRYLMGGQGGASGVILWVNSNMPTSALSPGYNENFQENVLGTDRNATNPYFVVNRMKNSSVKDRFMTSVTTRWDILDWLFVQGRVGQDYFSFKSTNIIPDGTGFRLNGSIDQNTTNFWERNFEGLIGINKDLNEDFALSVNLGGNLMSQQRDLTNISALGFVIPQFHVVNNTSTRNTSTGTYNKKINSLFATAELSYKNYLFFNVTGRNDWFSTLNPKSNNYFYPSAGVSFVFSDAMQLPSAFSFGKLRVAYASVGGDTDPYMLNLTYGLLPFSFSGSPLGHIGQSTVPNSSLRPLSVNESEIGLDLRMFNNRLGLDFALYNKLTTNDIAIESISTSTGYSGVLVNVGSIRNRGVEFLLSGKPVVTNDFSWDVSTNFAFNKSRVLKISNTTNELTLATTTKAFIKHIEGMEYSQIVGRTVRRNDKGEDIIDASGLPIVPAGVVPFGTGIHRWTTGLTNNFRYKGLTLSVQVDGKFGGQVYSETNYSLEHRGMTPGSLIGRDAGITLPGVTESGEPNTVFVDRDRVNNRAIIVRRRDALDDYLYDASFIKLRYISLSYNIPKPVYEKLGFVKGASVSLLGRNLAILMSRAPGIDPESQLYSNNSQGVEYNNLPLTRSWGFNVNLKF